MKHISPSGIALRFVFALLLILATYNPTGKSYYHWVADNWSNLTPYIAIAGLGLLIGWVVYLNATLRSLGFAGLLLAGAFLACFVWLLVYWGWLHMDRYSSIAWVSEILLAILLTVGMCWSIIRRMISGQVDTDDVDRRT